ncbi:MAG: sugar-binding protein, partial [Opitutaceae bacterium]
GNDRQFTKGYNDSTLVGTGSQAGVTHAWAAITGGYTVEIAIPWSNINVAGAAAGLTIGFDVANNDDDNGGTTRESQVVWAGTGTNYQNTSAFGDLTLSATTVGSGGGGAPTAVSITSPTANAYLLPDALVTITANATNATSVQFKYGTTVIGTDTTAPYTIVWDVGLGAGGVIPPVGQHQLTVTATNASGSTTSAAVPVIIELLAGVNTHAAFGVPLANHVSRMTELGATMNRDAVYWSTIETTAGVYNWATNQNFANFKQLISDAKAAGIRSQTIVMAGNGSLYPHPALDSATTGRAAYGNYGQALAAQLTNLRMIGIWNEFPDGFSCPDQDGDGASWDDSTPARYYAIQQAAYPKIKIGNPQAIVMGFCTARAKTYGTTWLQTLKNLGGGAYLDWLETHMYPVNGQGDVNRRPENSTRWLITGIQPIFPTLPILVTEYGAAINTATPTEVAKAEDLARAYMSVRTVPNIRGLTWHLLKNFGTNVESSMGLCVNDAALTPLPAFWSYQDVALIFRRALYYGRGAPNTGIEPSWFLKFKDATGDVYVAWREEDGPTSLSFTFTASAAGNLSVRPVKTTSTPPATTNVAFSTGSNTKSITLTTMPKFIRVPAGVTVTPAASYNFSSNPIP